MSAMERIKTALRTSNFHVVDFNDDNYICSIGSADLLKLVAVAEAAKAYDYSNSAWERLRRAIEELTSDDGAKS